MPATGISVLKIAIFLMALSGALRSDATEPSQAEANDEVMVTLSIKGANEMSGELATSLVKLADALNTLQASGIELSQAELDKLESVLETTHLLVMSVGENAEKIDVAINNAKEPLLELTADVMNEARTIAIQPALDELNQTVRRAFWGALFIVVLVAAGVAVVLWLVARRMLPVIAAMRKIMDDHVIVPRERWPADGFDLAPDEFEYSVDHQISDSGV